jgi:hypothetical protein
MKLADITDLICGRAAYKRVAVHTDKLSARFVRSGDQSIPVAESVRTVCFRATGGVEFGRPSA